MADVDLHPNRIDNLQMGYLFEHLVMRFNEQSNEEAGDHFTPREVIRLMANLIYTGEQDVYRPGIYRTIYDPTCGTGGMLSESEKLILAQNDRARLALFGQDYNDESWAICCSDMLIRDEDTANIVLGDTLGDGKGVVPFVVELRVANSRSPLRSHLCYATSATTPSGGASASRAPTRCCRSR